jgi:molybdenum cofactor synthesis domain-containing protein
MEPIHAAVITVSDKGFAGKRQDASGPLLTQELREMGAEVINQAIVPDERAEIERALVHAADVLHVDLILTTGGTGLTPRDVTPEATLAVVDRLAPGLAEALRFEGHRRTPLAALSRGVAGIRGQTLVVNLPGNPKAVREGMEILSPILPHAIEMLRGVDTEHPEVHHA